VIGSSYVPEIKHVTSFQRPVLMTFGKTLAACSKNQTNPIQKLCGLNMSLNAKMSKQAIHVVTTVLYRYDKVVSVFCCTTFVSAFTEVQSVIFIYCRSTSSIPLSCSFYLYGAFLCSLCYNNMYNASIYLRKFKD